MFTPNHVLGAGAFWTKFQEATYREVLNIGSKPLLYQQGEGLGMGLVGSLMLWGWLASLLLIVMGSGVFMFVSGAGKQQKHSL